MKRLWLITILLVVGACTSSPSPEAITSVAMVTSTEASATALPTPTSHPTESPTRATISVWTPTTTPITGPTGLPATKIVTAKPKPTNTPSPAPTSTSTPLFNVTPSAMSGSILVATGANEKPILSQVSVQGNVLPLGELSPRYGFWHPLHLSPDGKWLADREEHTDRDDKLTLYNFHTGETQTIPVPLGAISTVPIFDASGLRVAYTIIADLGTRIDGPYKWVIYVRDITSGTEVAFGGMHVVQQDDEPLPGAPIAWRGNELLIDTTEPYSEGYSRGIWALDISRASPGEIISLESYDRLVLSAEDISDGMYWNPTISPDGQKLAFLISSYDYEPPCHGDHGEEGSLTALGIVPVTGGQIHILQDATIDKSALATPLTWSPDGQQILFAQGKCQDESFLFEPTLRTVDLQGTIISDWQSVRVDTLWWGEALWCTPDDIFFLRDMRELWHLSLTTGQSERVLSGQRARLVGCLP